MNRSLSRSPRSLASTLLLKPLQRTNLPVRICKHLWVVLHVFLTRSSSGLSSTCRFLPHLASPFTAERRVEDDTHVLEALSEVTTLTLELSQWNTERRRVQRLGSRLEAEVGLVGRAVAGDEPDCDGSVGPLHGVDTSTRVVELRAVRRHAVLRLELRSFDAAADVFALTLSSDVAVAG